LNPLAAWWLPGTRGFDAPAPLEFASLVPPRSPNACLALPEGHPGHAHLRTPPLDAAPEHVFAALLTLAQAEPRATRLATWPERRQAQWVVRSAFLRFPDLVVAEAQPAGEGTGLFLYSRSLIGWSDLGVNRARVTRWLAALERALPPPAPPAPPPSRLARALAARAPGRTVLITDDTPGAEALLLEALEAGATSARLIGPHPPRHGDAGLTVAGERLGLPGAAARALAQGSAPGAPPPPHACARSDAAPGWWVPARWEGSDLAVLAAEPDLMVDGFGLHREAEPGRRLARLRATGARRLLLETGVLPRGLPPDTRLCAAALAPGQAAPLLAALRAAGAEAPEGWAWLHGAAAVEAELTPAGWRMVASRAEGTRLLLEAEAAP
jgi:uncharacterized protein (DUF1499 family)